MTELLPNHHPYQGNKEGLCWRCGTLLHGNETVGILHNGCLEAEANESTKWLAEKEEVEKMSRMAHLVADILIERLVIRKGKL